MDENFGEKQPKKIKEMGARVVEVFEILFIRI